MYNWSYPISFLTDRDELKGDFLSKIWCTYRKNFPAIGKYRYKKFLMMTDLRLYVHSLNYLFIMCQDNAFIYI